jgi:hypothetical protein
MTIKLQKPVDFVCPFCSLKVTTGFVADGSGAVAHQEPICNKFDRLDPAEFVHQAYTETIHSIN